MIIEPLYGYVTLEAYEMLAEQGKVLLLASTTKYTQIYKVLAVGESREPEIIGKLVYVKGYPTQITHKNGTNYICKTEDIIAEVRI